MPSSTSPANNPRLRGLRNAGKKPQQEDARTRARRRNGRPDKTRNDSERLFRHEQEEATPTEGRGRTRRVARLDPNAAETTATAAAPERHVHPFERVAEAVERVDATLQGVVRALNHDDPSEVEALKAELESRDTKISALEAKIAEQQAELDEMRELAAPEAAQDGETTAD